MPLVNTPEETVRSFLATSHFFANIPEPININDLCGQEMAIAFEYEMETAADLVQTLYNAYNLGNYSHYQSEVRPIEPMLVGNQFSIAYSWETLANMQLLDQISVFLDSENISRDDYMLRVAGRNAVDIIFYQNQQQNAHLFRNTGAQVSQNFSTVTINQGQFDTLVKLVAGIPVNRVPAGAPIHQPSAAMPAQSFSNAGAAQIVEGFMQRFMDKNTVDKITTILPINTDGLAVHFPAAEVAVNSFAGGLQYHGIGKFELGMLQVSDIHTNAMGEQIIRLPKGAIESMRVMSLAYDFLTGQGLTLSDFHIARDYGADHQLTFRNNAMQFIQLFANTSAVIDSNNSSIKISENDLQQVINMPAPVSVTSATNGLFAPANTQALPVISAHEVDFTAAVSADGNYAKFCMMQRQKSGLDDEAEKLINDGEVDLSHIDICPILQAPMEIPVKLKNGTQQDVYDFVSIQQWHDMSQTSPMTNSPFTQADIIPLFSNETDLVSYFEAVATAVKEAQKKAESTSPNSPSA